MLPNKYVIKLRNPETGAWYDKVRCGNMYLKRSSEGWYPEKHYTKKGDRYIRKPTQRKGMAGKRYSGDPTAVLARIAVDCLREFDYPVEMVRFTVGVIKEEVLDE